MRWTDIVFSFMFFYHFALKMDTFMRLMASMLYVCKWEKNHHRLLITHMKKFFVSFYKCSNQFGESYLNAANECENSIIDRDTIEENGS